MAKKKPRIEPCPPGFVPMKHNGKPVGHVSKDGKTYQTRRLVEVHRVLKWDAYGISVSVLEELRKRGVQNLVLAEELPSGKTIRHEMLLDDWHGIQARLGPNQDEQVFYPIGNLPEWVKRRSLSSGRLREDKPEPPQEDPKARWDLHSMRVKQAAERDGMWLRKNGTPILIHHMEGFHLKGAIQRCFKEGLRKFDQPLTALLIEARKRGFPESWLHPLPTDSEELH